MKITTTPEHLIDLNEAFNQTLEWNEAAGQIDSDTPATFGQLVKQAKINLEENKELYQASEMLLALQQGKLTPEQLAKVEGGYNPLVEVLDGMLDSIFTLCGMLSLVETLPELDVKKGWGLLIENNNSKIFRVKSDAEDAIASMEAKYNTTLEVVENTVKVGEDSGGEVFTVAYTVKDANGKVRKPVDFKELDLSTCIDFTKYNNMLASK